MVGQTPVNTQTGEILKMEKPPNKMVVFRHALRLFPTVFLRMGNINAPSIYIPMDGIKDHSMNLHICRTLISASTVLSSPSTKSIDQNRLVGLVDLLERGSLCSGSRSVPGTTLYPGNNESPVQSIWGWSNGSTNRPILGAEIGALGSATRALAVSLNHDLDSPFISSVRDDNSFFPPILDQLDKDISTDQSDLLDQPLWTSSSMKGGKGDRYQADNLEQISPKKEGTWSFWREWYAAFLVGKPIDWTLQSQIAFIPDEVWDSGVEKLSQEIERIKAKLLSEKLPQAETIEFNPESGSFFVSPIPMNNVPLLSALLTNISDAMNDALKGDNGLSERSSEYLKIRRAVTLYGNNPQQAELTLTTVAKGLRRQLYETNALPDSEDNLALLEAVEDGVRGIRANHPEVAVNREQLARQTCKEHGGDDRRLEQALPVLIALSEGDLARDFAEDIPSLINDSLLPVPNGAPTLPGADAATRVFSRVSKMALTINKAAEWHDSKTARAVRLGLQGISVLGVLYAVVNLGLMLLGVIPKVW